MSAVLQAQTQLPERCAPSGVLPGGTDAADAAAGIRGRFSAARRNGQRPRDAALGLGISEGQAIAAHAGLHDFSLKATALQGPWAALLQALEQCGPLMALTRNDAVVHEKIGRYENISASGQMGLALGCDIDLRLFFGRWHAGFAVLEPATNPARAPQQSLQFFDGHGVAVHKVFVRPQTDRKAFNDVVHRYTAGQPAAAFVPAPPALAVPPDADIDATGLAKGWSEMTDTHEFFGLLSRFGAERQQAFRLMQGRFTERAEVSVVDRLLNQAAMDGVSIMVFVSSGGCIQIHSGPVSRIETMAAPQARWLNVLDPGFSLHLREDLIHNAWIVEKPTADGTVTSVEIFDARGAPMAMFFGSRKPGVPEQQAWVEIVARLPRSPC